MCDDIAVGIFQCVSWVCDYSGDWKILCEKFIGNLLTWVYCIIVTVWKLSSFGCQCVTWIILITHKKHYRYELIARVYSAEHSNTYRGIHKHFESSTRKKSSNLCSTSLFISAAHFPSLYFSFGSRSHISSCALKLILMCGARVLLTISKEKPNQF